MANPTQARGFRPVNAQGGALFNGAQTAYKIASGYGSNIGQGDFVKLTATGYVQLAAAADRVLGLNMGVSYVGVDGIPVVRNSWIAGTVTLGGQDATIFVMDDPNVLVEGRFNNAQVVGTAHIGNTFPLVAGTPDTNGYSTEAADCTSVTATSLQTLRLVGFNGGPLNDTTSVNAIGRFQVMNHEYKATTGV